MPNRKTFFISFYEAATKLIAPLAPLILNHRAKIGKEDKSRIKERLGFASKPRPEGELIWFHGASVGESLIGINLAEKIRAQKPNVNFLFTSGTITSANIIEKHLQANDAHQYIPIDTEKSVANFLEHWSPNIAIFLESEIWPNLIRAIKRRNIPLVLANARMTASSLRTWLNAYKSAKIIFSYFDFIAPANKLTREGLIALGARNIGDAVNLKLSNTNICVNETIVKQYKALLTNRLVWLAASTHRGEEEIIIKAHQELCMVDKNHFLILAPRHPERLNEVIELCIKYGLKFSIKSKNETPNAETNILIWDTMGELASAFSISSVSMVCGSLIDNIGGHNPIEPAKLGSIIISGPFTYNFSDIYRDLDEKHAAVIIENINPTNIALQVSSLLQDNSRRKILKANATKYLAKFTNVNTDISNKIIGFLGEDNAST